MSLKYFLTEMLSVEDDKIFQQAKQHPLVKKLKDIGFEYTSSARQELNGTLEFDNGKDGVATATANGFARFVKSGEAQGVKLCSIASLQLSQDKAAHYTILLTKIFEFAKRFAKTSGNYEPSNKLMLDKRKTDISFEPGEYGTVTLQADPGWSMMSSERTSYNINIPPGVHIKRLELLGNVATLQVEGNIDIVAVYGNNNLQKLSSLSKPPKRVSILSLEKSCKLPPFHYSFVKLRGDISYDISDAIIDDLALSHFIAPKLKFNAKNIKTISIHATNLCTIEKYFPDTMIKLTYSFCTNTDFLELMRYIEKFVVTGNYTGTKFKMELETYRNSKLLGRADDEIKTAVHHMLGIVIGREKSYSDEYFIMHEWAENLGYDFTQDYD